MALDKEPWLLPKILLISCQYIMLTRNGTLKYMIIKEQDFKEKLHIVTYKVLLMLIQFEELLSYM